MEKTQKRKKKKDANVGIRGGDINLYLAFSKTFLGIPKLKSFSHIKIKSNHFSVVLHCRQHWVAIYSTKKSFEIFDSLGFLNIKNCLGKNVLTFISTYASGKNIKCNHTVQSSKSNLCGLFCVYYITRRDQGHSFEKIMSSFSSNLNHNDSLVLNFINKLK